MAKVSLVVAGLLLGFSLFAHANPSYRDPERCLMDNPEDMVCQIQLAEQLLSSKDELGAYTIYTAMDVTKANSEQKQLIRARLLQLARLQQPLRWQWSLRQSFDSNYLRSTSVERLTLTLPTGSLNLPIVATSRYQGVAYQQLGFQASYQVPKRSHSMWGASASVQLDALPEGEVGKQDLLLQADNSLAEQQQFLYRAQWYKAPLQGSYYLWGVSSYWIMPNHTAHLGLDVDYVQSPIAQHDGYYTGFSHIQRLTPNTTLMFKLGNEFAVNSDRTGGDQRRAQLSLQLQPTASSLFNVNLNYQYRQDSNGYSPLLANNAVREQHYYAAHAEYVWPLSVATDLVFTAGIWQQQSNIALFSGYGHQLSIGFRWL